MSSKAFIVALILVLPALMAPLALADTAQYKPRAEVPGDMCYSTRVGSFYDSDLFIPIKKASTDTWTGIVFPEISLAGYTVVNQANLTLYFTLEFSGGANETVTVYGYEDYLEAGTFESSAQLVYGPLTSAHVNINVSAITSGGFYTFDVTAIVNELLAHQWWSSGASMCFIVLGAGETVTRYVSSNEWSPAQFPILDLAYNVPPGTPEDWLDYLQTYKGYDIYEGFPGSRAFIIQDTSNGTQFLISYDYLWSEYVGSYYLNVTEKHVLPENMDLRVGGTSGYTIRDPFIEIGGDYWILTDPGSSRQVNLRRSQDRGATWELMHQFTWAGGVTYPTAYMMVFNPDLMRIHILIQIATGLEARYCYYDLGTDSGPDPVNVITAQYEIRDVDLACDFDTDNLYVMITGGATSSAMHFMFKQRIGGVWSNKFTMTNGYLTGIMDGDLLWSQQNSKLVAVLQMGDYSGTSDQYAALYEKGAAYDSWPDWIGYTIRLSLTSTQLTSTAVLNELYPEDLKVDMVGVQTRRNDRWHKEISTAPYSTVTRYDYAYLSPGYQFLVGEIFKAPLPDISGLGIDSDRKYFCSLELDSPSYTVYEVFEPGGFTVPLGVARHKIFEHDSSANMIMTPRDPFGNYGVYVYLNGSLIDDFDDLDEAKGYIDDLGGPPDPEDPNPPGWEEEEIFTRYQVILYLTIAGLAGIIAPPMFMAYKKDLSLIAPVLFLMAVGASLLLYLQYI
jgi:hypothetical protein